ncbi:single-strand DNA-binding protein [Amycolatopsis bartoniae]|uniref:single-stranded DNA-binding protein n=1 Tax=Amycolatopsis bartoniae TaxID=941986 RepID=UPI001606914E|nr:single-stranded DNA-binding protein [Amycolatopsis bartoniae]MBB2935886.1 single-strand DNA-binding protein [Amycolatopsis bartoniae]
MTVAGVLATEPECKQVGADGRELVVFWLRSTERRFDKIKEEWVDGRQLSVRVKCWRRLALAVRSTLRKGDPVLVTGRLSTSVPSGEEPYSRAVPEVEASGVGPNLAHYMAWIDRVPRPEAGLAGAQVGWESVDGVGKKPVVEAAEPVPVV